MGGQGLRTIVERLRHLSERSCPDDLTDASLIERFLDTGDEAAFELLVWRHHKLVHDVCRRALRNEQDVEDAFQATFLVFLRRASSISKRNSLASWLYKVAYRVSVAARRRRSKQQARQQPVSSPLESLAEKPSVDEIAQRELRRLVDDEVMRLPKKYQRVIVLFHFEGKRYEEVARQLGCGTGTVATWLTRARELLKSRLQKRGVDVSMAALASSMTLNAAEAGSLPHLVHSTVSIAMRAWAAPSAASTASAAVASLVEGTLTTLTSSKLRMLVLALCSGALIVGTVFLPALAEPAFEKKTTKLPAENRAPEPPRKVKQEEPRTAWGKTVNGLRAGLRRDDTRPIRIGEKATFAFVIENVGDRPISLTYFAPIFHLGGSPQVRDKNGGVISLTLPAYDGPVQPTRVAIEPGKTFELGHPGFRIWPQENAERETEATLRADAGKYRVSEDIILEQREPGDWVGELQTGELEIEIVEALKRDKQK